MAVTDQVAEQSLSGIDVMGAICGSMLSAMLLAGTLPERATPLPERRPGWQEGGPTPSPEASRRGAKNRHAGLPPKRPHAAPRKRPKRRRKTP